MYAKASMKGNGPSILRVQSLTYHLPVLMEDIKFKFRDLLLGVFEVLLNEVTPMYPSF